MRVEFPLETQAGRKQYTEYVRSQWTTHDKLDQWFTDVKPTLIESKLAEDRAVFDIDGRQISELYFSEEAKRRIINMDETHHDLGIAGDKSGYRNITYCNPGLQRSGTCGFKSSRHVTGVYATNAAGETLPLMLIFDSSAKSVEKFQVRPQEWGANLPKVVGRFGCPTMEEYPTYYAVRSRGSMDDSLLNH